MSSMQIPKWQQQKRTGVIFVLVLIIVLGIGWYRMGMKSVGTISTPILKLDQQLSPKKVLYEGKYFTFRYDEDFAPKYDAHDVKFPILERQLLAKSDVEGKKIAVLVQDVGSTSLDEYSSYRIRTMDTKAYIKEKIEKFGQTITIFIKNLPVYEAGAFWSEEGRAISIIITSPTQAARLEEDLFSLLETLERK